MTTNDKNKQLAILPGTPAQWSKEHLDLIRSTICHPSMSAMEIALFLEQCRRTELDPLKGEAFCVPRRVKITVQGREDWVDRYTFQPAEAGMAARAAKFPDYKGIRGAAFFEKDSIKVVEVVDARTGEASVARVEHSYEPNKDRGRLKGAWALALREGFSFSPEIVYLQEYEQRNAKGEITKAWQKPHTMILKCARSATERRVFPEAFSGIYSREEVQLEREAELEEARTAPAATMQPPQSRGDAVARQVAAKLEQVRLAPRVVVAPAPAAVAVEPPAPTPERAPVPIAEALDQITSGELRGIEPPPVEQPSGEGAPLSEPPAPAALKVSFGPAELRAKPLAELSSDDLIGLCALAEEQLAKATGKEAWFARVRDELQKVDEELARREAEQ